MGFSNISPTMKALMKAAFEQLEPQYAPSDADIAEKDAGALEVETSSQEDAMFKSPDGDDTWQLTMN